MNRFDISWLFASLMLQIIPCGLFFFDWYLVIIVWVCELFMFLILSKIEIQK